jgi:putative DNA modification/repair radical SAM protein
MDVRAKLEILADAAKYDASCASGGSETKRPGTGIGSTQRMGICHSFTPDGRCVSLLKVLLTNHCIFDCQYCVNRISSDVRRARFSIDEVVWLTLEFYRRNYIEGLFLSSGIIQTPDYTMEQLVEVGRQLREDHGFRGYIHFKTIAGCDPRLIECAGRYADRLSVNIELPTPADLSKLAPEKKTPEIVAAMQRIKDGVDEAKAARSESNKAPSFAPAGQSTQMIVGATDTPDRTILATANELYEQHDLRRIYYSAYSPIPHSDDRLPPVQPPLVREHRLYQADWLTRFYGFRPDELTTAEQPNLSLDIDPKLAWALSHREFFPVDVNRADKEALLRIPGIGARSVEKILSSRRHRQLRVCDLKRLRIAWKRAATFVIAADHVPSSALDDPKLQTQVAPERQLLLFESADAALSGEL